MGSLGQILTFYSYKGGVGRSMGLANVAALLTKWRRKVLIIDWDLEAPGIESYFEKHINLSPARREKPGVIDLVQGFAAGDHIDWHDCLIPVPLKDKEGIALPGDLKIITAGQDNGQYMSRVQHTNWEEMFSSRELGTYLEDLRNSWKDEFDYVLIDSRTGITDIGGVCTIHLPDVLVVWFTTNETSMQGVKHVAEQARVAHDQLPFDRNPLLVLPVPSRDESRTELERATKWQRRFADELRSFYIEWLPKHIQPASVVERLRIPYIPYWSFEEGLPVIDEGTSDLGSIGTAYDLLTRLLFFKLDWEKVDTSPEQSIDYLQRAAEADLTRFGPNLADALFDESLGFWKEERRDQAAEAAVRAVGIWESLAKGDLRAYGLKLARAKKFLSELLQDSDEKESTNQAKEAVEAYRAILEIDPVRFREEVTTSLLELSETLHNKDPEIAIETLSQAIDLQRRLAQSNPRFEVELARALHDIANWYIEEKQFRKSLIAIKEAVLLYRRLISIDAERFEPDLAESLITLSECLLEAGDLEEALSSARVAVEIYKVLARKYPKRHESDLVKTYNALLDILSQVDFASTPDAAASIKEAVTFFRTLAQKDPVRYEPELGKALGMLQETLSKEARRDEALQVQREAIDIFRHLALRNPAQYGDELAQAILNLARLLSAEHDKAGAKEAGQEALEMFRKLSRDNSARYNDELDEATLIINGADG